MVVLATKDIPFKNPGTSKIVTDFVQSKSIYNVNQDDQNINVTDNINQSLNSIPPLNNGNVVFILQNDLSEDITINNYLGNGTLEFNLNNFILNGNVYVQGCAAQYVWFHDGTVNGDGVSTTSNRAVIEIDRCDYVRFDNVYVKGNGTPDHCIYYHGGSKGTVANSEVHGANNGISASNSAFVSVDTCSGEVAKYGVHAYDGGLINMFGDSKPKGDISDVMDGVSGNVNDYTTIPSGQTTSTNTGTTKTTTPPPTTTRWKSTGGNNYSASGYWSNDGVKQGNYGYGRRSGYWFFGSGPSNAVTGKTIKSMRIYINRASTGGKYGDVGIVLRSHNYTSKPSGKPSDLSESSYSTTVNMAAGDSQWVSIPSTFFADFQSGTAKGIGIYVNSDSSDDYAVMQTNCTLEITYS